MRTACLLVALAMAATAGATVRVFVTTSSDPYGLEDDANHMVPTVSTVYANGVNVNGYDYWADYDGTLPGPLRPGSFPPVDAPSGTPGNPVTIVDGDFAYIWLQFQSEPNGAVINGVRVVIRELGQTDPAPVSPTYYVCNNMSNLIGDKRWDGTATPPDYPEWHNNSQMMVAIVARGLRNLAADLPWNLWQGSSRIALLGAVEGLAAGTIYEILILEISYWQPPNPVVAGGVFQCGGVGPRTVPPGFDCWRAGCGRTQYNFRETPLPPDFFDPGSEAFSGIVHLRGSYTGDFDARIERLDEMVFDAVPSTAGSAIRVESLELVSCQPIQVMTDGQPVAWDVAVGLSEYGPSPQGAMVATRTYNNGGTYTAGFSVQPVFDFTRVDPPYDHRVLDTGLLGQAPLWFTTMGAAPFVFQLDPNSPVFACGTGFAPGVEENPPGQSQHGRQVAHVAGSPHVESHFLEIHPQIDAGSPSGTCHLPDGSCLEVARRDVCEAMGGQWQGADVRDGGTGEDGLPVEPRPGPRGQGPKARAGS